MPTIAAGILLFRVRDTEKEVFLVHPGGPFWAGKDAGSWSIPKGILEPGEDELVAAKREFKEETGCDLTWSGTTRNLGVFRISASKTLRAWAVEGDFDPAKLSSNSFELEWPPRSGHTRKFPEVDRCAWFEKGEAEQRIARGQRQLSDEFYRAQ